MRKPRVLVQGATYHVFARANRREFIFHSKIIRQLFIEVVKRAKRKYRFTMINFCIMSNHIHFMIRPGDEGSLSQIMQWILSVFASSYNRVLGINGHVWYDRFKSQVIRSLRQWAKTFEYINENPIRAHLCSPGKGYEFGGPSHIRRGLFEAIDRPETLVGMLFPSISILSIPDG